MKNNLKHYSVLIILLISSPAMSALHVNAEGTSEFPTIQAALNAASNGDVILLEDGIYLGSGNTNLEFYSNVTLRSTNGFSNCIIDCQGSAGNMQQAFNLVEESGGTVEGITVRNAYSSVGAAVITGSGSYTFESCFFTDNHATERGGVWHGEQHSVATFRNCIFSHNTSEGYGGALSGTTSSYLALQGCTLVRNGAPEGGAIYLDADAEAEIENSLIAWGIQGSAFGGFYYSSISFFCSDIFGNRGGDWVNGATGSGSDGNLNVDPLLIDPMDSVSNLYLSQYSPCSESNNSCGRMGALPRLMTPSVTYGVSADAEGMFATIQDAVDYIPDNQTVTLNDGIYTGAGNNNINPAGKSITLLSRSNHPENCQLDLNSAPGSGAFVLQGEEPHFLAKGIGVVNGLISAGAVVDISGSNMDVQFSNCNFEDNRCADTGFLVEAQGDGTIGFLECRISQNETMGPGALFKTLGLTEANGNTISFDGCTVSDNFSDNPEDHEDGIFNINRFDVLMTECLWSNNQATNTGCLKIENSHVEISQSQFVDNNAFYCSLWLFESTGEISHSQLRNNISIWASGSLAIQMSDIQVQSCRFEGNRTDGYGGGASVWANEGHVTVKNVQFNLCEFINNEAGKNGGGLYAGANGIDISSPYDSQELFVTLSQCTFHHNKAMEDTGYADTELAQICGSEGGIFGCGDLDLNIEYCLVTAGNECAGLVADSGAELHVECTNIKGNDKGDWLGWRLEQQFEYESNISSYPYYCNAADGILTLNEISVCLPDNNICAYQIGANGVGCYGVTDAPGETLQAASSHIVGNAPNPFNPRTTVFYELARNAQVFMNVYDVNGRLVRSLIQGENQVAGLREVVWDGRNNQRQSVAAGVYFVRLNAGGLVSSQKVSLIK